MSFMSTPTFLAYAVLSVIFIYYLCQYSDFYPLLPLVELLWNCLVYLTPESLISFLHPAHIASYLKEDDPQQALSTKSKNRARKSEALRKMLGLNGTGISRTVQHPKGFPTLGTVAATASKAPPGLGNWDNSCYQNSILQGLASLNFLPEYLNQGVSKEEEPTTGAALKKLVERLNSSSNAGQMFWTPPELKNMSSWQQQDAQEYFSKVLDELDKEVSRSAAASPWNPGLMALVEQDSKVDNPRSGKGSSGNKMKLKRLPKELNALMARNPLEGLLAQRVGCLRCGYVEGLSVIPFNCLTVPLGRQWMYDIRTCLDEYTSLEPINGVECAKCTLLRTKQQFQTLLEQFKSMAAGETETPILLPEALKESLEQRLGNVTAALDDEDFSDARLKRCEITARNRVSTTKTRQAVIARAPKSLVIHVNRSVFDEMTGAQRKNLADVRFPGLLDLSSWCLGSDLLPEAGKSRVEEWTVNPATSMLSPEIQEVPAEFQKPYELCAVITHSGRHENGHYICYRKYPAATESRNGSNEKRGGRWWRLSDDEVSEVSKDNVLSQGGVFMLFYERTEHTQSPKGQTTEQVTISNVQSVAPTKPVDGEDIDEREDTVPLLVRTAGSTTEQQEQAGLVAQTHPMRTAPDSQDELGLSDEQVRPRGSIEPTDPVHAESLIPAPTPEPPSVTPTPPAITPSITATDSSDTTSLESAFTEPSSYSSSRTNTPSSTPGLEPGPSSRLEDAPKDDRQVTPTMRTAPPRGGRDSVRRSGKGMGQVLSMISAN